MRTASVTTVLDAPRDAVFSFVADGDSLSVSSDIERHFSHGVR